MFHLFAQVMCFYLCWTCILSLCFPASHIFKTLYQVKDKFEFEMTVWTTLKVWHDRLLVSVRNEKIAHMHYINISLSLIDTQELLIGFLSVINKWSINCVYSLFFNEYFLISGLWICFWRSFCDIEAFQAVMEYLLLKYTHSLDISEKSLRHFPQMLRTYFYIRTLLNIYVNGYQTGYQICEVILCIYCCV